MLSQPPPPPLRQPGQASMAFLEDLLSEKIRWGPLLAYCFMHGMTFTTEQGSLEPELDEAQYLQVATDALAGMQLWLPRLGLQHLTRPGARIGGRWGSVGVSLQGPAAFKVLFGR